MTKLGDDEFVIRKGYAMIHLSKTQAEKLVEGLRNL